MFNLIFNAYTHYYYFDMTLTSCDELAFNIIYTDIYTISEYLLLSDALCERITELVLEITGCLDSDTW